ncbi:aspartyl-tRNA synthetase-like protein [Boeremia exigua]|uniref:aspartyl-tRNA synthetase-like protein n=1 Tax=Boeremia exigua TaxID=749465 RepID=UPI001E8D10EF|nr:aspartyl-tRNA synthetase-like protein [Boeremia exigua]KAH6620003.1 aspartyl-tRNA synthetase-like protein [Boeremia exigua]
MSLVHASRHVAGRGACRWSSYAEISRFVRTRPHSITFGRAQLCSRVATRSIASVQPSTQALSPEQKLRNALDDFKASTLQSWRHLDDEWRVLRSDSLNHKQAGREVEITGYLGTRRDISQKLSFAMLRSKNQTWCIQIVSTGNAEGEEAKAHNRLRTLREWTPVVVRGRLLGRKQADSDTYLGMKMVTDREISLTSITPLNEMPNDIIIKQDTVFGPEQRHLQLRTDSELRENILMRHKAMQRARLELTANGWREIETPILFKSTPEGAREFLVPTRTKGLAYALPQSPQQYKQILMASGITKYYQFARCFRDEDLRADRQPEFTQLDMEMSFAGEEDMMAETEKLLRTLWYKILKQKVPESFPRMTYQEAMASYGSDKPDLRHNSKIHNITQHLPADLIGKITPLEDSTVDAIKISISSDPKVTRRFISDFLDSSEGRPFLENPDGQPGVFVGDHGAPMQGLGPLGHQYLMEGPTDLAIEHGDLLVVQARPTAPFAGGATALGTLRLALHKAAIAAGLAPPPDPKDFRFLWIHDFPLFSPTTASEPGQGGAAGLAATHHPFTAPKTPADVELLLTAPTDAVAAHYDIVVNGVELGGGSRRIHSAAVQEFVFRDVLCMAPERVEDFRHLLDVLRSGCPPHCGLALGWDRVMAVMCGKESVRDVIAFPKSGRGEDLVVKSPNRPTEGQWDTYGLQVKQ